MDTQDTIHVRSYQPGDHAQVMTLAPARSLYHALGYREEDIRLTKAISSPGH
jgi:hypothetical protein